MAILEREIEKKIEEHLIRGDGKILLVVGARQVGKSTSIEKVGKKIFPHFIKINLYEDYLGEKLFSSVKTVDDFHLQLSSRYGNKLGKNKGDTLIFLDEIGVYPDLIPLLKFLKEEGLYSYIVSGSSLGIALRKGKMREEGPTPFIPMGAVSLMKMYPLSFKEFLVNHGYGERALKDLYEHFERLEPLSENNHGRLFTLFKHYLIIGGMPEAVSTYLDTKNIVLVRNAQSLIHDLYAEDASRYDEENSLAIRNVYEYLPSTMENKKKRIVYKDIESGKKALKDSYLDEFDYLVYSGIALRVDVIASPHYPLSQESRKNLLKLYLNDVGILTNILLSRGISPIMNEEKGIDMGSIYETFVAMELASHGLKLHYYDNKKFGEVDFLIDDHMSHSVMPIEVKSGKDYVVHRAMDNIVSMEGYGIEKGVVLSNEREIRKKGKIIYLPIYFAMFLGEEGRGKEEILLEEVSPYEVEFGK